MEKTLTDLLSSFSGTTPLFPLPDFVFFPQTVQPFHIFEPRYLEMVKDAMASERMVIITLIKEEEEVRGDGEPPVHSVATLGYINNVQPAGAEKLNILVTGLVKARIEEVESDKAYRRGAVIPLTEFSQVTDEEHKRKSILRLFKSILETAEVRGDIDALYGANIPLQMLAHIIISALPIAAEEKQKMLELQSLELRVDILMNFLESGLHSMGVFGPFEPILPSHPWWN